MTSFSRARVVVSRLPVAGSSQTPGSASCCCSSAARACLPAMSKVLLRGVDPLAELLDPFGVFAHGGRLRAQAVALLVLAAGAARARRAARDLVPPAGGLGGAGRLVAVLAHHALRPRTGRLLPAGPVGPGAITRQPRPDGLPR